MSGLNPRTSTSTDGPITEVVTSLDLPLKDGGRRTVHVPTGEGWESATGQPIGGSADRGHATS